MAIKGVHSDERGVITPHLLVRGAGEAADFYKRAFGAKELYRSRMPHSPGLHIHMRVHSSTIMITDETPPDEKDMGHFAVHLGSPQTLCGTSVILNLNVDDVDASVDRAADAGAKITMPPSDTFWGDRYAWVTDPFGHIWALSAVKEVLTPEEIDRRVAEMCASA